MKWILLFIPLFFCLISFNSQAEIVESQSAHIACASRNGTADTPSVFGYALTYSGCVKYGYSHPSYISLSQSYPSTSLVLSGKEVKVKYQFQGDKYLLIIQGVYFSDPQDILCPTSHQFETQDGQCSDEIADIIPDDPLPEKQENGCYPSGTSIDTVYGPSSIKNKSSCFSDSCSATIRPSDTVTICTHDSEGIERCQFNLVSSGQSCVFDASNPNWSEELPPENSGDYTPSDNLSGGGVDSGAIDSSGNPVSGAESTNTYEQQLTNENLKRLIDDQATLLTDLNKSLNSSIDYDKVKTGYLKQISENTKNLTSGGGGGGSSSGDGGDWSGSGDSIVSDSCDSFACESHPVICQLAKEEWLKRCEVDDFLSSGGDGSQIADGLQNFIDENPNELLEAGSLDVSKVMNKYTNGEGLSTSATCPSPKSVDAGITTFQIDYTPFCDMAVIIKALIIIFSSVTSILLISKYM